MAAHLGSRWLGVVPSYYALASMSVSARLAGLEGRDWKLQQAPCRCKLPSSLGSSCAVLESLPEPYPSALIMG
eukprot:357995-Chlamydomonas_euryale.AAC.6